ncbi:hypothetical protein ALC53_13404 [Atta colombica]|uniref:Uncharacterized protein n=1 Tax=Atta colombica TaxID=520822 RepID=A0A195AWF0_9HYME|nr:hypothetical protein ALC53_13404 [Atta colombica]
MRFICKSTIEFRSMYFLRQRVVVDVLSRVQRSKSKLVTCPKNLDRKLCKQQDLTNNAWANQEDITISLLAHQDLSCSMQYSFKSVVQKLSPFL